MKFHSFSRPIQLRIILRFFSILTNTAVMPFVPLYFVNEIGQKMTTIFTIVIGLIGVIGNILGGQIADRFGRKNVILIGECFAAFGFILLTIAQYQDQYLVVLSIISFSCIYFFTSLSQPAYSAFVLDETTSEIRKDVYTFSMWSSNIAFALGTTMGGLLFANYKTILFLLDAFSSIISFIVICIWIPESIHKAQELVKEEQQNNEFQEDMENHQKIKSKDNLLHVVFKNKILLILLFIGLIFALMDNQLAYYLSIHFFNLFGDSSYQLLGFFRTENTIISIVLMLWVTNRLKRFKDVNVAISGTCIFFIGYILLSSLHLESGLYMAMFIASIGEIVLFPAIQTITANEIPTAFRARFSSLASIFSTIGALIAVLFMLIDPVHFAWIVQVSYVIIGALTLILLFRLKKIVIKP